MPPIEPQLSAARSPTPLSGGALFPMIVFGIVCRRLGDSGGHPLRGRTWHRQAKPCRGASDPWSDPLLGASQKADRPFVSNPAHRTSPRSEICTKRAWLASSSRVIRSR